jgi:hypothetical protein
MATNNNDRKISQLPLADPLTGDELLPLVQNGRNKRVSVSTLASLAGGGSLGGGISSVNGIIGPDVVLTASDVGAATTEQGAKADTSEQVSRKNQALGYAGLDGAGKIPLSLLPNTVLELKGSWDANTNTPRLANGTGQPGDMYIVSTPGTVDFGNGPITFALNDSVYYGSNGRYFKSINSSGVTSVNSKRGIVVLDKADIGLSRVDNTSDLQKPVSIATIQQLNLKVNVSDVSEVAFSGDYTDLINKPTIPNVSAINADISTLKDDVEVLTGAINNVENYISSLENGQIIYREKPTGTFNGINTVFTLANAPTLGTEQVFVNGLLQEYGETGDYIISGNTIEFNNAPKSYWSVFVTYATGNVIVPPVDSGGGSSLPPRSLAAFQWSSEEKVYPLERASDGSVLYCKEIEMGFLACKGGKSVPHGIQNYDAKKLHTISGTIYNTVGSDAVAINSMAYGGNFCILDSVNVSVFTPTTDWTTYKCNVRLVYSK